MSKSGFSLLELLVALALMSTLMIVLYNAFFQFSASTQNVNDSLKAEQELRLLMKIVFDDLQAVQYLEKWVALNDETSGGEFYHSGILSRLVPGPDETLVSFIRFHTARPTRFFPEMIALQKDPELHEVEYSLRFDAFAQAWLFVRREDFYVDGNLSEGGVEQTLSQSVVGFRVEFLAQMVLAADSGALQEVWVEEWDSLEENCLLPNEDLKDSSQTRCLPLALRLTLSLQKEEGLVVTDTLELNHWSVLQPNREF